MKLFLLNNWKRLLAGLLILTVAGVFVLGGYIYKIYTIPS